MIQVTNITKAFGEINAVNGISFTVNKGDILGLLGPNGAGKSTTINMLSSLFKPDFGTIFFNHKNLFSETKLCKKMIGVVPQEIALYNELTAEENLYFFGKIYRVPTKELKKKVTELLLFIGLNDRKKSLVKTFSGGMKRRVNIAVALLQNPEILLMDEPTVGVDPQSRNKIFEIIEMLNAKGMTIIYTTHYMEEIERLCNRIAIMDNGKIVGLGTQEELKKMTGLKEQIEITFEPHKNIALLHTKTPFKSTTIGNTITIECDKNNDLKGVLDTISKLELTIEKIQFITPNLEQVFLNLTGKELRD